MLITSGPTSVPIDRMRIITNRSTGEMGRLIANAFTARHSRVTLLEGPASTSVVARTATVRRFFEFGELSRLLEAELARDFDVVIHAAAVSDFELARPFKGKVPSGRPLTLRLRPTRKLAGEIKRACPAAVLVVFKLEASCDSLETKARRLLKSSLADRVVANTQEHSGYEAFIIRPDGSKTEKVTGKRQLVKVLLGEIDQILKTKKSL